MSGETCNSPSLILHHYFSITISPSLILHHYFSITNFHH